MVVGCELSATIAMCGRSGRLDAWLSDPSQ